MKSAAARPAAVLASGAAACSSRAAGGRAVDPRRVAAAAPTSGRDSPAATATADIGWRDFFADPKLEAVIERALANNRDLRVAVLNVEKARAQYRIQRADRVPSLGANAALARTGGDDRPMTDIYTADLGHHRVRARPVRPRAQPERRRPCSATSPRKRTRRSAQLALIAEVANAYLTLAADQEQAARRAGQRCGRARSRTR